VSCYNGLRDHLVIFNSMEDRHSAMVQAVASTLRTAQTNCTLAMFSKVNGCGEHVDLSLIGMVYLRDRRFDHGMDQLLRPQPSYCCRLHPIRVDVLIKPLSGTRVRPRPNFSHT
jgi:hypothetical protein